MSAHEKALKGIFDDLDDFESKKMFGDPKAPEAGKGFSVTITMNPDQSKGSENADEGVDESDIGNLPADHDESMCKGGCAMHMGGTVPKPEMEGSEFSGYDKGKDPQYKKGEMGMADGGMVPPMGNVNEEDTTLPPFLRKKKPPFGR